MWWVGFITEVHPVLVEAVRTGILSVDEGNVMLSNMIAKGYFSPFERLNELL
ncbi:MAG: hypothetical protein JRE64_25470 [Deltaproteobacteria bacterium]|nr:hypothetical protein [Deltaproteobacteria bacterium]